METMESMFAARYNIYWYLSFVAPMVIMLIGTLRRKKSFLMIAILISLVSTYYLCNISVQKKWQDRFNLAVTEEEREYAHTDGANLAFTTILIGPFEAVLYTSIWGVVGWYGWPKIRKSAV